MEQTGTIQTLSRLLPDEEMSAILEKIAKGETPLWTYWAEFVEYFLGKGRSVETVRRIRDSLRFFLRNTPVNSIEMCNSHINLEKTLTKMKTERNISHTTMNTYAKSIGTYFRWLEYYEIIEENKMKKMQKWKEEINEQYVYTHEQVKAIKAQVHDRRQKTLERHRNALFIDLLANIGARPVELLHLKCSHIKKIHSGAYVLEIKGAKQKGRMRHYTMSSSLRDSYLIYTDYLKKIGREEEFLLVSTSKKGRWTDKGMRCLFKHLSKELEFRVTAYSFRRYVATSLYEKQIPLEKIAKYLGHTRISTTEGYIRRSTYQTAAGSKAMEKILGGNLNTKIPGFA